MNLPNVTLLNLFAPQVLSFYIGSNCKVLYVVLVLYVVVVQFTLHS